MYEVTASNFTELTPKIFESIKRSKFVSFDGEFSGINSDEAFKVSLFDTGKERYEKLRDSIRGCIAIQFGLTTYDYDQDANKYGAESFNFYLFPKAVPGRDAVFQFRSTAVEFLTAHGFDFNKFTYEGISYLNEDEETELRFKVADNTILRYVERSVSHKDEDELKVSYDQVSEWLKNSKVGDSMSLEAGSPMVEYLLQKELRTRFLEIWTDLRNKKIILQRVDKDLRKILKEKEGDKLEKVLVDSYLGFSKIFKLIVSLKKPIVGHNVLLDLMFMHQQFYKPLPNNYFQFKDNIHRMFPTIYDTKHISFDLKRIVKKEEIWKSNSLTGLYDYFKVENGKLLLMNVPKIELVDDIPVESRKFHEAGWDSYCAGYCFIRLAHIFCVSRYGEFAQLRPLTNAEIMSGPKEHTNCVNVIRASISHMNFGGPDPVCARPQWLHVKYLGSNKMNIAQIAEMFSTYGAVDVKLLRRRQALVAVANHRWGGVLVSGSALVWILHQNLQRTQIT